MKSKNNIGIQLGRLSPRPWPDLKKFPFLSWREEFCFASQIGYDSIEWIFDTERYKENPLWSAKGREEINNIQKEFSIAVNSLCADFFLKRPFFRGGKNERNSLLHLFKEMLEKSAEIGVRVIVLPIIEKSEIGDNEELRALVRGLEECEDILKANDMYLGLETIGSAEEDLDLLDKFNSSRIGLVYDLGNHTSAGHDCSRDISILHNHIINVHVKDRLLEGPSVFLGEGDLDLADAMKALNSASFKGDFVMETYYEYEPFETARNNYLLLEELLLKEEI